MSRFVGKLAKKIATPGVTKRLYNLSGFNKYGLLRDDLLREDDLDVKEALRRIPEHVRDERNFRIIRATYLDTAKKILPEEQWTKLEEDVLYLSPVLEEVIKEREEKERWEYE